MKPPSFASNSRLSAELMEATSTAAAVTAPAATTEGAAGGWWSATAAAAAASAASLAAPAATTAAWHAARAGRVLEAYVITKGISLVLGVYPLGLMSYEYRRRFHKPIDEEPGAQAKV